VKELVDQIHSVVSFCGFEIESVTPHPTYITFDLKSKKRFRKRNYRMAVSKSLNGILAAERELSRSSKNKVIILDPVNYLPEPTFSNVLLFHDINELQEYLTK